jgi:Cell Wall Hydrolase
MNQGVKKPKEHNKGQKTLANPFVVPEWPMFAATIWGEAANCSPSAWRAIASVILNRVNSGEWKRQGLDTVAKVISKSGFDAFTQQNRPYREAFLTLIDSPQGSGNVTRLVQVVQPLYLGHEEPIPGVVLYYSPKAQKLLHQKNPDVWRSTRPNWNWSLLEQVAIPGAEADDLAFFKYKSNAKVTV